VQPGSSFRPSDTLFNLISTQATDSVNPATAAIHPEPDPREERSGSWSFLTDSSRCFWGILLAATAWKLFAGRHLGLGFDECYYWEWSLHPQLCYLDHPPLTAWLIAAGRAFLGHSAEAVRIWPLIAGILLALFGRDLALRMFGRAAGNRAGIFLILAPIFAGNALLMTPDTCLVTAWAAALLFAWRGMTEDYPAFWWLATGVAAGFGMLSKYTMVIFYLSLMVVWFFIPGKRRRLAVGIAVAGTVSLIFFLPVLWWNSQHGWISFGHQLHHGFRNEHQDLVNLRNLGDYAAFLVILVSPLLALSCFRSAVVRFTDERYRYLAIFFWTVVLFFGFSAAKAHIEANWPMTAFISGLLMVAGDWESYGRAWRKTAIILLLVMDLGAVAYLSLPKDVALTIGTRSLDLPRMEEFLGSEEVATAVRKEFKASGADFLCVSSYQFMGILSFYAPELEPLLWLPDKGRGRFPWIDDRIWAGKNALVATLPRRGTDYRFYFATMSPETGVEIPFKKLLKRPVYFTYGGCYKPERIPKP
jgi:hypothetical protein